MSIFPFPTSCQTIQLLAKIAAACTQGRDDLAARGLGETGARHLRPFSTLEITKYPIPIALAHFRRALRQHPDLPQGVSETDGGKWCSLDEVLRLRAHFGQERSKAKENLPYRPAGLPTKIVAVANFKGGVGKNVDLHTSGDVRGIGWLSRTRGRSRQPRVDGLDLRRQGRR